MKKKIVFGLAAFLFAAITTLSFATDTNPPVKEVIDTDEGGGGGGDSCTVTTYCYVFDRLEGIVSCTGKKCSRNHYSVTCDDKVTLC